MRFRPCIDIHNGAVKQIVGSSLSDVNNHAENNFVSEQDAAYYAGLYKRDDFQGGHIIILNPVGSEYYEADLAQAKLALEVYPKGMQIGGGVNLENAERYLDLGASHIIVTSYVFRDGMIDYERLEKISDLVGKEHLVLDLSCRLVGEDYFVVTDRWQKVTNEVLTVTLMKKLSAYCDEFLIHAVDVEGKASGIEQEVVKSIADLEGIPVTYAGGIHTTEDLTLINKYGKGRVDFTIGSALDLFGGTIPYATLKDWN